MRNNITKKNKKNTYKNTQKVTLYSKINKKEKYCQEYLEPFKPFEATVEELFKKNNINFNEATKNLENDLVLSLKMAVNDKKIKPNNDFY